MKIKQLILIVFSIVILNTGLTLQAEEVVSTSPSHFGTIDDVRIDDGQIVIGDLLFPIVSYTKVHPSGKYSVFTPEGLKTSMTIGFRLESITGIADPTITEIWMLDSLPERKLRRLQ